MNLKLNALVLAAVVASAMSGAANALTNNEIFLVASDTSGWAPKTFIAALGQAGTAQAFTGTTSFSIDYSGDVNWQNFIAGSSNVTYQVIGLFQSDPTRTTSYNADDKLLVSSLTTPGRLTNNSMNQLMAGAVSPSGIMGGFEYLNAAVTGTSTGLVSGFGADGIGAVKNNVFSQYLNVNTQAALGEYLNFYSITRPTSSAGLAVQVTTQYTDVAANADTWHLRANGQLSYVAGPLTPITSDTPEADTSAMMLIGLGLMSFMARRRKNQQA
ncbi:PEP-CTERM sorting domain-containing protein [Methylotenera sp.]|uniref:PEP-CTERM sorting domain-containing protein n=1 Tax=Methylotenera sp. TaxID=2051956 RepID=UPI002488527D|nr:PEP-CTERM sorting domain-containing protein [Methylotenera sp.]MDI1361804.1 PEP-CTERM sorting domain-containing protein [Methylotenera sp.]